MIEEERSETQLLLGRLKKEMQRGEEHRKNMPIKEVGREIKQYTQ